jgi:hypothetical protein
MAKTIGQLTQATTLASGDEFVIEQSGLTKRIAASVVRGGLVNADVDAAAAIAGSKLADGGIVTAKIADANVTPAKLSQPLTLATAQNTTSGTSIDFTGIPSWVKRITVMFAGVSTNSTSRKQIQFGTSTGFVATGYAGGFGTTAASTVAGANSTTGITLGASNVGTDSISGIMTIALCNTNTWVASFIGGSSSGNFMNYSGGSISLSGALDRIRLTTENGTDTFDAGSVNIMYEG